MSTIVDKFRRLISTKNRKNPLFRPLWRLGHDGARAREIYDRKAKERQKSHGGTAPGKSKTLPANLPEVKGGDARDAVGKAIGVSGKTFEERFR